MPTEINLFVPPKERAAQNRVTLQKKAASQQAGTYVEKPSKNIAWKEATKGAEARASMTSSVLENQMTTPDASLQKKMSEPIKTPSGGRAAGALTKEPMPEPDFKDLGEAKPGASLAQAARARGIAASLRENRSSVGDNMSHEAPTETDLHAGGKPWLPETERGTAVATGAGKEAGAMMGVTPKPKDLGRVTAKVARGEYGELSPKTASAVKGSFLGRAAESVAGKLSGALGMYGGVSLAAKAASAMKGMSEGKAVNPLSLDTEDMQDDKKYLTIQGSMSGKTIKSLRGDQGGA